MTSRRPSGGSLAKFLLPARLYSPRPSDWNVDMSNQADHKKLLELARKSYENSYAPYSKYRVGAALLTKDGRVFQGCNIEIVSYEGSICAERVALAKAVSEGCRDFQAIAVVAEQNTEVWPCGVCRQYLAEFGVETLVVVPTTNGSFASLPVKELLPHFFPTTELLH